MKAFLILEDGTVFEGKSIGAVKEVISEIVFNTSMTGYLEVLTDPSYAGQAVTMTYPLIGNYGVCYNDMESLKGWPDGFIVREISRMPSNFRSEDTIQNFLEKNDIPGICSIDTRALVKLLREKGTMNGMITTNEKYNIDEIIPKLKEYKVTGVVEKVSCSSRQDYVPGDIGSDKVKAERNIAVIDVGTKKNIIRCLLNRGCNVTVYPCTFDANEVIKSKPDGIMITNGPGDPAECTGIIEQVKLLADSGIPVFAICLGHQLMALAHGAKTYKMKYGHRGANHPVKNLETGKVYISSQNHGYVVDLSSIDETIAKPWFINVNDGTAEGLSYIGKPVKTVQFHPEANAGPKDSELLFDEFIKMTGGNE
ncbi:MAG: carbamoyl phosphate synthase small subunit [Lachnospiraceae bacterium]|jgi:carbamoyl-phosphate synthase, small subunit|nr:carbamoyl phosphate synthase small subunit [Lachnospiraceae bacterium]